MTNLLDWEIAEGEFELSTRYYILFRINTFRKGMNVLIPSPAMGEIVSLLSYKDGFGIK